MILSILYFATTDKRTVMSSLQGGLLCEEDIKLLMKKEIITHVFLFFLDIFMKNSDEVQESDGIIPTHHIVYLSFFPSSNNIEIIY